MAFRTNEVVVMVAMRIVSEQSMQLTLDHIYWIILIDSFRLLPL